VLLTKQTTGRRSNGAYVFECVSSAAHSASEVCVQAKPLGAAELPPRTAEPQAEAVLFCPSPAILPPGGGLVTLWDLLHNYAAYFFWWGRGFERADATFKARAAEFGDAPLTDEHLASLFAYNATFLEQAKTFCATLELNSAAKHVNRIEQALLGLAGPVTWAEVHQHFERLRIQMEDDLADRVFYYVKPDDARAYATPPPPWDAITKAFPSTEFDVTRAWQCLALGQPTASAFHALRVAEKGLQQLAREVRIRKRAESENWHRLIEAIEAKANGISTRTKPRRELRQFLVDTLSTFDLIKDAWRDSVMHARGEYDDPTARIILLAVGKAMAKIAERYHEEGAVSAVPLTLTQVVEQAKLEATAFTLPPPSESADTSSASQ